VGEWVSGLGRGRDLGGDMRGERKIGLRKIWSDCFVVVPSSFIFNR